MRLGRFDEMVPKLWVFDTLPYGDAAKASALAIAGQHDDARTMMDTALKRLRETGDEWSDRISLMALLEVATRLEDKELVRELSGRLQGSMPYSNNSFCATRGKRLGNAALLLGDPQAARSHFVDGLAVAQKLGIRPEIALVRFQMARLFFEHFPDEKAEAAEHLNFATHEFQAMKMQLALQEALALKLRFQGITSTDINTSIDTVARVAIAEQPDLMPHAAPDGTVTIMFSDIEGSTATADRLGDAKFMDLLREHNAIIREQIKGNGGFEVKSEGDGFMVAFQSAGKALACATAIQRMLAQRNESAEEPVQVRMGLHAGEVIKEGEDFFGRNVIMAARVAAQARGGEILTSSVVKALLQGSDVKWADNRTVELKGLSGEHEIWRVDWER
jgi:class 3 adenylate cyclase